jgi:hypothetical protein
VKTQSEYLRWLDSLSADARQAVVEAADSYFAIVQARIGLVLMDQIELRDRLIADLKAQLPEGTRDDG